MAVPDDKSQVRGVPMRSSLMMNLLRILTPEEINELTTTSEGNKRVPLTQLMYVKMGVASEDVEAASLAKILPFTFPEQESSDESEDIASSEIVDPDTAKLTSDEEVLIDDQINDQDPDEKMQTSSFILFEKKRLAKNVHKMRQKEIMQSYKKNASLDIEQEKGLHDDMSKSSRSGVLVNKKHA